MRAARRQEQTFQRRIPVKEDTVKRRARLTFQCAGPRPTTWRCTARLVFAMHCGLFAHILSSIPIFSSSGIYFTNEKSENIYMYITIFIPTRKWLVDGNN